MAAGSGSTAASIDLTSLLPGATYHFRIDATDNGETVECNDATFTTPAQANPMVLGVSSPTVTYGTASTTLSANLSYVAGSAPTGAFTFTVGQVRRGRQYALLSPSSTATGA